MHLLDILGGTDRVDHLRDSKSALGRAQPHAVADVERRPDADHHDRVKHRRGLSRQYASEPCASGRRYPPRVERPREQAQRDAGTA